MLPSRAVFSLVILSLTYRHAASYYTPVYLFQLSAYNNARDCVQECAATYSDLGVNKFGCDGQPATCLCSDNVDQSSVMNSWFSSCALSSCGDEPDASTAAAIFRDYCEANYEANAPVGAGATATAASAGEYGSSTPAPGSAVSSSTPSPTPGGDGDNDGNGSGSGSGDGSGDTGSNNGNTNNYYGNSAASLKMTRDGRQLGLVMSLIITLGAMFH